MNVYLFELRWAVHPWELSGVTRVPVLRLGKEGKVPPSRTKMH